jgi:hypothetical protein
MLWNKNESKIYFSVKITKNSFFRELLFLQQNKPYKGTFLVIILMHKKVNQFF